MVDELLAEHGDGGGPPPPPPPGGDEIPDWCKCGGNCRDMPKVEECVCCLNTPCLTTTEVNKFD